MQPTRRNGDGDDVADGDAGTQQQRPIQREPWQRTPSGSSADRVASSSAYAYTQGYDPAFAPFAPSYMISGVYQPTVAQSSISSGIHGPTFAHSNTLAYPNAYSGISGSRYSSQYQLDSTDYTAGGRYGDSSGPGGSDVGYATGRSDEIFNDRDWIDLEELLQQRQSDTINDFDSGPHEGYENDREGSDEDDALGSLSHDRTTLAEDWESIEDSTNYGHSDGGIATYHETSGYYEHPRNGASDRGRRSGPELTRVIHNLIEPTPFQLGDTDVASVERIRGHPSSTYPEPGSSPPDLVRSSLEVEYEPEDEAGMPHFGSGNTQVSDNRMAMETSSNLTQRGLATPTHERPDGFVIDSNENDRAESTFSSDNVDIDMTAILDPSTYVSQLENLENVLLEKCNVAALLGRDDLLGLHVLKPTADDQLKSSYEGLISAIDFMQEQGVCAENIIVLVQDSWRADVVQAVDIPISAISELPSLLDSSSSDASGLNSLIERLCSIFGIAPGSTSAPSTGEHSPKDYLGILCSLLRLTVALYAKSHHSGSPWQEGRPVERITYYGPTGDKHVIRCRRLACLHEFVGDAVCVFNAANDYGPARVSMSVEQLASIWGPIYVVPSSKGIGYPIAIQTEGGLLYRSSIQSSVAKQSGLEVPCHWVRATPAHFANGSPAFPNTNHTLSFKSNEKIPAPLEEFSVNQKLLIGHPAPQSVTSTLPLHDLTTAIEFGQNDECSLDLKQFGLDNAFQIRATGAREAYSTPNEHHITLSAGQYFNIGLQKTWRIHPAITHKDRIISFCSGSLATTERLKQTLQLRVGLEVSACTTSARRVTLEEVLKVAFPNEIGVINDACMSGNASVIAGYLGELKPTGVGHDGTGLFHWPLSVGISEVYRVIRPPLWLSLLEDTPESCCFASLSARCFQFTTRRRGRLTGSMCTSKLRGLRSPALHTCIEINPESNLRPPLKPDTSVPLVIGELRIHQSDQKQHVAFYSQPKEIWLALRSLRQRTAVPRELQVATRPSRYTFDVCVIDAK